MAVVLNRLPRRVNAAIRKQLGLPAPEKYGNRKERLDGYLFGSGKELRRYLELLMRQGMGHISSLTVHPKFTLRVNDYKTCSYTADFSYYVCHGGIKGSALVVEDVKSKPTRTRDYRIKKKLMKAVYGIEIKEVI